MVTKKTITMSLTTSKQCFELIFYKNTVNKHHMTFIEIYNSKKHKFKNQKFSSPVLLKQDHVILSFKKFICI